MVYSYLHPLSCDLKATFEMNIPLLLYAQEKVCEDSASFDLTSTDIAHCVADVGYILDLKVKEESTTEEGESHGSGLQALLDRYVIKVPKILAPFGLMKTSTNWSKCSH